MPPCIGQRVITDTPYFLHVKVVGLPKSSIANICPVLKHQQNTPSLRVHTEEREFYGTADGREALGGALQDVVDRYRAADVAAELARRRARQNLRRGGGPLRSPSLGSEDAGWFDAPRGSRAASAYSGAEEPSPSAAAEDPDVADGAAQLHSTSCFCVSPSKYCCCHCCFRGLYDLAPGPF